MGRSIRMVRERLWVVWWLLVVALLVPVYVGDDGVGAQKVEPTDTTAAAGSGTGPRDHDFGEQPPNCSHGEVTVNLGTSNEAVKCRACARRTYAASGSVCGPVDPTPACVDLGLVKHAIVSSWPGECVPIYCPTFRHPQTNQPPPENQGEWRYLSTGDCRDVCPSGTRWSTARVRCVTIPTASTTATTMATGTPEDLEFDPELAVMPCTTYSAEQDAAWYLNTVTDAGALTDATDKTHYKEKMANHPGSCPPSGLFEAGIDELIAENPKTDYNEHYQPHWAYDGRLFGKYGLIAVKPGGEFDEYGDNPGPKDFAPSDGCSGGRRDVKDGVWDRRAACGAHDYCWSLLSFGVSGKLAKADCDSLFEEMMQAECQYRKSGRFSMCNVTSIVWSEVVRNIWPDFKPGNRTPEKRCYKLMHARSSSRCRYET